MPAIVKQCFYISKSAIIFIATALKKQFPSGGADANVSPYSGSLQPVVKPDIYRMNCGRKKQFLILEQSITTSQLVIC